MSTYCVFTNRHCIYPACIGKEKDLILPGERLTVTLQMKGKCSLRGKRKLNKQLETHMQPKYTNGHYTVRKKCAKTPLATIKVVPLGAVTACHWGSAQ